MNKVLIPKGTPQTVTFVDAQEEDGKYGAYYRVLVDHNGERKRLHLSPHAFNHAFDARSGLFFSDLKQGDQIKIWKKEDKYSVIEFILL